MRMCMLTTIDNPYSPFDNYPSWFAFDSRHGYNSSSLLARICMMSNELTPADEAKAIEDAIDEIVRENVTGVFMKVTKEVPVRSA